VCLSRLTQLNIMKFRSRGEKVENDFPHLFQGIGKLKGVQVKINIDDSVSPDTLYLFRALYHTYQ
jgi:hypothetical protein